MKTKEYAKLIRQDLKKTFPNIKFSVRSDVYSMGSSININYSGDIERSEVEKVVQKYEQIDRDQYGEILSGGNMFVFVNKL